MKSTKHAFPVQRSTHTLGLVGELEFEVRGDGSALVVLVSSDSHFLLKSVRDSI